MSATSILRQMYACENRIDKLNNKISQLEDDIDELNNLNNRLNSLQEDFVKEYNSRRNDIETIGTFTDDVKLAKTYYDGMNGLINGSSYYTANNSIVNSQINVNNKIRQLNAELEEKKNSLGYEYSRLYELECIYDEAVAEESTNY